MSDNVNTSARAKPTGERWPVNELASNELEYADSHNHLLQQDAQIAFPVNGKIDQKEIQKQIRILEEVMQGKLSTQVEIDPGKGTAEVRFLDFAADKFQSGSDAPAKGAGSDMTAGKESTLNGPENAKLEDLVPVPAEEATKKDGEKAEDSAACQEKLPEVAYLLNLPEAPKDWDEVEQIQSKLRYPNGYPANEQGLQNDSLTGVVQPVSSTDEMFQELDKSERRSFNLLETVSQEELDAVKTRFFELSKDCEAVPSSTVWNGIAPKTSVVVLDGNEIDAIPRPIDAIPSPTPNP